MNAKEFIDKVKFGIENLKVEDDDLILVSKSALIGYLTGLYLHTNHEEDENANKD